MVTRLRKSVQTIETLAFSDDVTGLYNRGGLFKALDEDIGKFQSGWLLLLDLDDFKSVNDMFGHDTGDKMLLETGKIISEITSRVLAGQCSQNRAKSEYEIPKYLVGRLGGDEFAIWVAGASRNDVAQISTEILDALRTPFTIGANSIKVGSSIGSAHFPSDGFDRSQLFKAADLAMYEAKKTGKERAVVYSPNLLQKFIQRNALGEDLYIALSDDQIVPFFQPQYSLKDSTIYGVEALMRWNHPRRGLLSPHQFLPVAQELGMMRELDNCLAKRAIQQLQDLRRSGITVPSVALNLSEEWLFSPSLIEFLDEEADLPFEVRFELMETMGFDSLSIELETIFTQIRSRGFKLDLDDFGAAKASMLGLMNVVPSHLKIDGTLISEVSAGSVAERLVRSIIDIGHSLEIPVIAEGVRSLDLKDHLAAMDCDFAQGYALAKPMNIVDLAAHLGSPIARMRAS